MGEWEWSDVMQAWAKVVKSGDKEAGVLIQQRPDGWHIMSDQELSPDDPGAFRTIEEAKSKADQLLTDYLTKGV